MKLSKVNTSPLASARVPVPDSPPPGGDEIFLAGSPINAA